MKTKRLIWNWYVLEFQLPYGGGVGWERTIGNPLDKCLIAADSQLRSWQGVKYLQL